MTRNSPQFVAASLQTAAGLRPPLLGWVAWSLLIVSSSLAQDSSSPPIAPEQFEKAVEESRIKPESEEFKQATGELREHLKQMREAMVRFNVSESPSEEKKWKDRWLELQAKGHSLHRRMIAAAVQEYRSDTADKPKIADMLFRLLKRNFEADRYEGMVEVAQALIDDDYPEPKLRVYLTMSALALNEYELAGEQADQLVDDGTVSEDLLHLDRSLNSLVADWEEERKLREQDSQGEPLPRVLIKTTKGDMEVELFENQAPETVGNFIHLAESGFYRGRTFHRVIEHFMAQGGCPNGDGMGGPGYFIYGEMDKPDARKFFRGSLGMALAQNPDSAGSQFFITFLPTQSLNGKYTVFGRVISGIEVLADINRVDSENKEKKAGGAEMPDEIVAVEVLFKRDHEYVPNKVK